ncbi:MAG: ABC transporter permease, partial [Clostridia bacterium]|nr:ABC transporter permease [Clostridia bacterium]
MYIIKNAFKSISRSLSRNILIGIIIVAISAAACIGLSIRKASDNAKESSLENMSITAQISFDMQSMMNDIKNQQPPEEGFNRDDFKGRFEDINSLSLDEMQKYAGADSVSDFYYTSQFSVNGEGDLEPVSSSTDDEGSQSENPFGDNPMGFMGGGFGNSSDFTVIGYSSENAMTEFNSGVASITDGAMFDVESEALECIIPSELATYNSLEVGQKIKISNPDAEDEIYTLKIVGIFESTSASSQTGGKRGGFGASDPSNQIYISAPLSNKITESSSISASISGTYVFENVESYEQFESQARELGLSEDYTISSSDVSAFEQSLVPLETLSTFAKYFLIIVLFIGAVILIVFNLFNIRERKYEVGVLCAIGMKKWKVALQFMAEILAVTIVAISIGGAIGAVSSVPVTNALLANQVASQEQS